MAERPEVHRGWLEQLTRIPTAAGREWRVVDWITAWADERPAVSLRRDEAGNLVLTPTTSAGDGPRPIVFTAHLDHPAFVVEQIDPDGRIRFSFRGGVRDPYFARAAVRLHGEGGETARCVIEEAVSEKPFRRCVGALDEPAPWLRPGDVGVWALPEQEIVDGILHTDACDDLAGVAAALAALDVLVADGASHVSVLLTLAEEVGFVGALAACKTRTIDMDAAVITLENSRSFAESPIGGGPIIRVGDRRTTFSPTLTGAIAHLAAERSAADETFRWQRKLMDGGSCEATVFCAYGYDATCLCLPLGNYHNQADLAAVEAEPDRPAADVGREHIALADFHGLVELLVLCGQRLDQADPAIDAIERNYAAVRHVLTT